MNKIGIQILLFSCICTLSSFSEMREWSDKKGNSVRAEFSKMFGKKVILKLENGKQMTVPASGLSDKDKEYLSDRIPPQVTIKTDLDIDRETTDSGDKSFGSQSQHSHDWSVKSEKITISGVIKQTSQQPCKRTLTIHSYIFGMDLETRDDVLLSYSTQPLKLKIGENVAINDITSTSSSRVDNYSYNPLKNEFITEKESGPSGKKYKGYLLYIIDNSGQIIDVEASNSSYEKRLNKAMNQISAKKPKLNESYLLK